MIFKQTKRKTYTIVENAALRDKKLSFKATGLLAFLLSLPDEWTPNSRHLAGIKTDGRDSVLTGLRELENAGYLKRRRIMHPNGTFDWVIEVYERPLTMDGKPNHGTTETGSPWTGSPSTDEPSTENPDSKESLRLTTDEKTTEEKYTATAFDFAAIRARLRKRTDQPGLSEDPEYYLARQAHPEEFEEEMA